MSTAAANSAVYTALCEIRPITSFSSMESDDGMMAQFGVAVGSTVGSAVGDAVVATAGDTVVSAVGDAEMP